MSDTVVRDPFLCPVCRALFSAPVTAPCGHSLCSGCLEDERDREQRDREERDRDAWDQDERAYSCPRCREGCSPEPPRDDVLVEVVEQPPAPPAPLPGPVEVPCDFCPPARPHRALMSCLACQASFCDTHLQPHRSVPVLQRHTLVTATARLQEALCPRHHKLLEVYCRTDQACICYLCTMDEHKGHDTVSTAAERTDKQKQLGESQQDVHQRVQERERELRESLDSLKSSAQAAGEASERVFSELIQSIETRRAEVKELITAQEKTAVAQALRLLDELEDEKVALRRRDVELEKLSHTDDHIHFIQSFQSLTSPRGSDQTSTAVRPLRHFRDVSDAVSDLRDKLEDVLKESWPKISATVSTVDVVFPPEPRTREDFLQYACLLSLDPNTTNNFLSLSVENRKVSGTLKNQRYPEHPERFSIIWQVLCREGQSARCYWEVEWTGFKISASVAYRDITRTGYLEESHFGSNDKSWSLLCSIEGYWFRHDNVETKVSGPQSSRVGMYLDHQAGTLSFYSVSDTMTLLHTVQTAFTQPVYPGIRLCGGGTTAVLCKIWSTATP